MPLPRRLRFTVHLLLYTTCLCLCGSNVTALRADTRAAGYHYLEPPAAAVGPLPAVPPPPFAHWRFGDLRFSSGFACRPSRARNKTPDGFCAAPWLYAAKQFNGYSAVPSHNARYTPLPQFAACNATVDSAGLVGTSWTRGCTLSRNTL